MDRKPIRAGQLLAILNQRMQRNRETASCRIVSIAPLPDANRDSCNWSSTVAWESHGDNRELAAPLVEKIVRNAQKEFNLLATGANSLC